MMFWWQAADSEQFAFLLSRDGTLHTTHSHATEIRIENDGKKSETERMRH